LNGNFKAKRASLKARLLNFWNSQEQNWVASLDESAASLTSRGKLAALFPRNRKFRMRVRHDRKPEVVRVAGRLFWHRRKHWLSAAGIFE
jgi:hypothetical protein